VKNIYREYLPPVLERDVCFVGDFPPKMSEINTMPQSLSKDGNMFPSPQCTLGLLVLGNGIHDDDVYTVYELFIRC